MRTALIVLVVIIIAIYGISINLPTANGTYRINSGFSYGEERN